MLVTKPHSKEELRVSKTLSIPLDLPEFQIINQFIEKDRYFADVKKESNTERCPYCGFQTQRLHDYRTRTVRDLPIFNKPLFLNVQIKRFRCKNCNELFSQHFESINPGQHQTIRFREYLYALCHESTIQKVSREQRIAYSTLERIYYAIASEKLHKLQRDQRIQAILQTEVTTIGMDEIAVRKGHTYETVLVDLEHGGVLGMAHERSYESAAQLLKIHPVLSQSTIQTIVVDMWDPFHKAIENALPSALIVIDKYHVIQKVTQALDQVRKKLQSEQTLLKKKRLLFLMSLEKLSEKQKICLDELLDDCPDLAHAYYLKELFRTIYLAPTRNDAKDQLTQWIDEAKKSPFKPFHQVANMMRNWREKILNYFDCKITNARTEGTNHKIKNIKRRAYGYRNLHRFRTRVMLECSGLNRDRSFIEWLDHIVS